MTGTKNLRPVFPLFLPQLRNFTSENLQIRAGVFSRVLLADLMGARVIGCGRKRLCPNAIKGGYLTSKASVFRQTGPDLRVFSMRIQSERFTGFSGRGRDLKEGIRGHSGLEFTEEIVPPGTWSCKGRAGSFDLTGRFFPALYRPGQGKTFVKSAHSALDPFTKRIMAC